MALKTFKNIQLNDKGTDVKKIAAALKKHGSSIKPTSVFTIGMRSAVVSFQKKHNLKPTGIVNQTTWNKLMMPAPVYRKAPAKKKAGK